MSMLLGKNFCMSDGGRALPAPGLPEIGVRQVQAGIILRLER